MALAVGFIGVINPGRAGEYMQTFGQLAEGVTLDLNVDGGYVVAGRDAIWIGNSELGGFVQKLDKDGTRVWSKHFVQPYQAHPTVISTTDNGYLVIGSGLTKFDGNGHILWQKAYGNDGVFEVEIRSAVASSDGSYFLIGSESADMGSAVAVNGWVAKVDATGNPVWQRRIQGQGQTYLVSGVQVSDSVYVVVGVDHTQGLMVTLDAATGLPLSGKLYPSLYSITSVIRSPDDSGLVVLGASQSGAWLAKLDSVGEIVWQKTYARISGGIGARSVLATNDGAYLLLAIVYDGGWVATWVKVDASGEVLWVRTLPSATVVADVRQTLDGGFLIVGISKSAGALILKVDANGDLPGCGILGSLTLPILEGSARASSVSLVVGDGSAPLFPVVAQELDSTDPLVRQCNAAPPNYQGHWWNYPAGSESGWGINFAHQRDTIFATWYTYDLAGTASWLSMTANRTVDGAYAGTLLRTSGPAFNAIPFDPSIVTRSPVGIGKLTFSGVNSGTFAYTLDGIQQSKSITRMVFGPPSTCIWSEQPDLAGASNYQDLWWVADGAESGWGISLTQQGDIIFATWFTYDTDGTPLWLSVTAAKTGANIYSGQLIRTAGPAFSAVPFDPADVTRAAVGTATFTFANGSAATFAYTIDGVVGRKTITRLQFTPPTGTLCQ